MRGQPGTPHAIVSKRRLAHQACPTMRMMLYCLQLANFGTLNSGALYSGHFSIRQSQIKGQIGGIPTESPEVVYAAQEKVLYTDCAIFRQTNKSRPPNISASDTSEFHCEIRRERGISQKQLKHLRL